MKRKTTFAYTAAAIAMLIAPFGCERNADDGPPAIVYDEAVCIDCGMIISDERYASATIVESERGREALLFDDVGDQIRYEKMHPELVIRARWVHDHNTREWLDAEATSFIRSDKLHTPMASGIASFATQEAARAAIEELGEGELLSRAQLWQ